MRACVRILLFPFSLFYWFSFIPPPLDHLRTHVIKAGVPLAEAAFPSFPGWFSTLGLKVPISQQVQAALGAGPGKEEH